MMSTPFLKPSNREQESMQHANYITKCHTTCFFYILAGQYIHVHSTPEDISRPRQFLASISSRTETMWQVRWTSPCSQEQTFGSRFTSSATGLPAISILTTNANSTIQREGLGVAQPRENCQAGTTAGTPVVKRVELPPTHRRRCKGPCTWYEAKVASRWRWHGYDKTRLRWQLWHIRIYEQQTQFEVF